LARKPLPNQPKPSLRDLKVRQADVNSKRAILINEIVTDHSCIPLGAGCFTAGTKLWTPDGFRTIETIQPGERVMSRDQWDEHGEIAAKIVEEVFTRFAGIWELVMEGRSIRTTMEHPFFVVGKGWTAAHEQRVGDTVTCAEIGRVVTVESIRDTGDWEPVYNLRVAEYHTYFVGDNEWGFSVWAHNQNCYDIWIDKAYPQWKAEPAVGNSLAFANVSDEKAKNFFRMWNDTYRDYLKTSNNAATRFIRPQWETLARTNSRGIWSSVLTKFKQLEPKGVQARKAAGDPPLSEKAVIAMQAALEVICTYRKHTRGSPRSVAGVGVTGRPQDTDADHNHQATVAWYAADAIVHDKANTSSIYMDRSLNSVLSDLGVTGIPPMSGTGSKPDLIRVRPDGKFDITEVQSPSQSDSFMDGLVAAIETYLQTNCPDRLGLVRWKEAEKSEASLLGVLLPT
jgi:hypothetical protein